MAKNVDLLLAYFMIASRRRTRFEIIKSLALRSSIVHAPIPNGVINSWTWSCPSPPAPSHPRTQNRKPGDRDSYPPGQYIEFSQNS